VRISSMDLFLRRDAAGGAGPAVGGTWASLGAAVVVRPVVAVPVEVAAAGVVEVGFGAPRPPNRPAAEEVAVVPPEVVSADDFCPMVPNRPDVGAEVAGVAEAEVCPRLPNKPGVGADVAGVLVEAPKIEDDGALVAAELATNSDGVLVVVVAEPPPNSPGPLVVVATGLWPKSEGAEVAAFEVRSPNSVGAAVVAVKVVEAVG